MPDRACARFPARERGHTLSRYADRLNRVARALGCQIHGEPLNCPTCEPPAPYPEPVETGTHDFIEGLVARVGREGLKAAALRLTPAPVHEPCPCCGSPRQCLSCQARYGHAFLAAIGLMPDERATMETLLATCRRMERGAMG
jgi:hypothetical protein